MTQSVSVNVYLKLEPDNKVTELIKNFNDFLEEQQIFKTYQITPYLVKHPLHLTLYMTNYDKKRIPEIIRQTELIAKKSKKAPLLTSTIVPHRSGYVMLSVANDAQLQSLSNKSLMALFRLRDPKTRIPAWVTYDAKRQEVFNQYGSPSVLNYFAPHFSILSAEHLNKYDQKRLYTQLERLVKTFVESHTTELRATANAIGVGIANENGQIEKELASFPLG